MADEHSTLAERLKVRFEGKLLKLSVEGNETTIEVSPDTLIEVCRTLRDDAEFRFEQLMDVSGVDYLGFGDAEWETADVSSEGFSRGVEGLGPGRFNWEQRPAVSSGAGRFAAVLHLLSIVQNRRLRVRCFGADDALPVVPTVTEIWPSANWFEREAFDLYGLVFEGHPDLRRILTDYGFVGHPFRKDFPLIGNVEVRYDPEKGRVVYEPVSIDPRVGVPRVIRHDSRYEQAQAERSAGQGK
jgi:NADH-quinone oxidoreductase subunit C